MPKRHCGNWKRSTVRYRRPGKASRRATATSFSDAKMAWSGTVRARLLPGLDIRGDGGYVVLPPSIHPSGRPYVWSVDSGDHFAEAPAWLTNSLTGSNNRSCGRKAKSPEHWHHILTNTVSNGARNSTLTSICGKLLHTGVTELALLYDVMCCINLARCQEPLSEGEVHTIVASVARTHLKRLRGDA
jgi:hypothetical protein